MAARGSGQKRHRVHDVYSTFNNNISLFTSWHAYLKYVISVCQKINNKRFPGYYSTSKCVTVTRVFATGSRRRVISLLSSYFFPRNLYTNIYCNINKTFVLASKTNARTNKRCTIIFCRNLYIMLWYCV